MAVKGETRVWRTSAWQRHLRSDLAGAVPEFILGTTEPTTSNTGHRFSAAVTYGSPGVPYNLVIASSGTYERILVYGKITVTAATGVVLRDCQVQMTGDPTSGQHGILFDNANAICYDTSSGLGNLVEYCTVSVPDSDDRQNEWFSTCIRGRGFRAYRNKFSGTTDGVHLVGKTGDVTAGGRTAELWGNHLSGFTARPSAAQGTTHNDGLQIFGSMGASVIGNHIEGGVTSCIILNYATPPSYGYGNINIADNWLYGYSLSGATLNIATSAQAIPVLSVLRNRVDRNGYDSGQLSIQAPHRVPANFGATSGTSNGTVSDWVYGPNKNYYMDNGAENRIQVG